MDASMIENAQVNREFVYRFLWRCVAVEPDAEALELASGPVAAEQFAIFFDEGSAGLSAQRHLAELAASALGQPDGGAGIVSALRDEYTRLFVGPATPVAPLWESVHRDHDHLMFTQHTLAVREAYRAAGYAASAYPKEADDHLAIELDFMAALAHQTGDALAKGDFGLAHAYCEHQALFLAHHLNVWVPMAYDLLSRGIPAHFSDFYPYALALAREVCNTDAQLIDEFKLALGKSAQGA